MFNVYCSFFFYTSFVKIVDQIIFKLIVILSKSVYDCRLNLNSTIIYLNSNILLNNFWTILKLFNYFFKYPKNIEQ